MFNLIKKLLFLLCIPLLAISGCAHHRLEKPARSLGKVCIEKAISENLADTMVAMARCHERCLSQDVCSQDDALRAYVTCAKLGDEECKGNVRRRGYNPPKKDPEVAAAAERWARERRRWQEQLEKRNEELLRMYEAQHGNQVNVTIDN